MQQNIIAVANQKARPSFSLPAKSASPFVKWVGGKRSVLSELIAHMPSKFNNYYEPFVGGGALFFALYKELKNAFLSDINIDLILSYQVIKKNPNSLISKLEEHADNHNEKYYYEIRSQHDLIDPVDVAARFIYLNKTCYNGLFRVNQKNEFNVPVGTYKNPDIVTKINIMLCSEALKNVSVLYKNYNEINPSCGDFVYFDPPYHPTTETSFTSYSKSGFTEKDQLELHDKYASLAKKGVHVMLSNSNTSFIKELYKNFNIVTITAPRVVNCKPNKRNSVEEVLIKNYE